MNKIAFLILVSLATGWLLKPYIFPSNEEQILNQAKKLVQLASIDEQENRLEQLAKAKNISAFFTPTPLLQYKYNSKMKPRNIVKGQKQLREKIFLARNLLKKAHCTYRVEMLDITGEDKASMRVKAKVYWQKRKEKKKFYAIHIAQIEWEKIDGTWLIQAGEGIPAEEGLLGEE